MDQLTVASSSKKKCPDPDAQTCANCLAVQGCAGASKLSACARCGSVSYCSKDCQRAHWKANHKQFCIAKADRAPSKPSDLKAASVARAAALEEVEGDACAICLEPLSKLAASTVLPCTHVFHSNCVAQLRRLGVQSVCPLCRGELLSGPTELHDRAMRRYVVIYGRIGRGEAKWHALTVAEQREMGEVASMTRSAAEQGLVLAQYNMGIMLNNGHGIAKDFKGANKWFRKAAERCRAPYPEAAEFRPQFELGVNCRDGNGVKQDYKEAVKWFREAAEKGSGNAQGCLARMYETGRGVSQDSRVAAKWMRSAAEDGGGDIAQYNWANYLSDGTGVTQNYVEAMTWYLKAEAQGRESATNAQHNIGMMYVKKGRGVSLSATEAHKWWLKAALQGHVDATDSLGVLARCGVARFNGEECGQCGAPGDADGDGVETKMLKWCPKCFFPAYCGKDCQLEHWKSGGHKEACAIAERSNWELGERVAMRAARAQSSKHASSDALKN